VVSALEDGVPDVADMEVELDVEVELEFEVADDFDDVEDEEDVVADAEVLAAVRAAMFAPNPMNAHTLNATAATRDRAAAWRRRAFFRSFPGWVCMDALLPLRSVGRTTR